MTTTPDSTRPDWQRQWSERSNAQWWNRPTDDTAKPKAKSPADEAVDAALASLAPDAEPPKPRNYRDMSAAERRALRTAHGLGVLHEPSDFEDRTPAPEGATYQDMTPAQRKEMRRKYGV